MKRIISKLINYITQTSLCTKTFNKVLCYLTKISLPLIVFAALNSYAVKNIELNLEFSQDEVKVSVSSLPKGVKPTYRVLNDYLIIDFNQQIAFRLNKTISSIANTNYIFSSFDKKSIFIKLKFKPILGAKSFNKNSTIIHIKKPQPDIISSNLQEETQPLKQKPVHTKLENLNYNIKQIEIVNSDSNMLTLAFEWDNLVGCAAFSQGQYSWIFFNNKKEFDASLLKTLGIFEEIKVIDNPSYTILRFKHSLSGELKAELQGNIWNISFIRDPRIKILPGSLINEISSLNTRGRLFDARKAEDSIIFKEDITGETLIIVPLKQADIGVAISRNFIDYILNKSPQGMVITKINEETKVKADSKGVEITSPNYASNIHLHDKINQKTREILKQQAQDSTIDGITKYTMLPFFEKGTISTANYNQEYYKLLQDISKSDSSNIHDRRHELAKFLFLHEMYNEAAAILSLINEEAPRFMLQRPEVKFLYSVSFTLSGRYDEAEKNYRSLLRNIQNGRNIDEIKIWLNLNNFYQYNTNQYVGLENFEDRFIFTYPDNLYFKIALTDLEVALKNNNNDLADKIFNGLREFKREDIRLLNNIKYLRAKYFINKQEYEKAKQYLNALKLDNRDPYNQVKAQIELAKTQLNLKEIDTVKAITILNSIKQNWRGDFVEYDLLMLLAKLYRENSQPINALRTYKYIIESSPLKTDQLFITAEMISLFNKIFSPGGAAETMSNFDTVSLFYEFKELTPIGSAGDNVVIQIANRLVNLDLLETAETLLKHQVTYRLIGEKRVDVGDKLAYIYLINKKPDLAIKVLDETDKDNFAYNEHLKRIRLKAKAYLDMQNFKYALQLIKDDNSVAADLLREEIYFKTQNWEKYISLVEPDVLNKINKGEEFFNTDKQTLIQLLISYLMVSDKMKLNLLKDRLKTSNIEIKNLIEFFGNQTKSINYKDLEESLNLKNIDNFLESIKKDMFDNGKNIGKDK